MTESITPSPEEAALLRDPQLSEASAEQLIATSRAAAAIERGVPPGLATLERSVDTIGRDIAAERENLLKAPPGSTRAAEITARIIALTGEQMRLSSHAEQVSTQAKSRRAEAEAAAAPLILPPLDPWLGVGWDEPALKSLRTSMRTAGVGEYFQGAIGVVSGMLHGKSDEIPKDHELPAVMRQRWGENYDANVEAVENAWDMLSESAPRLAASLQSRRFDLHPKFLDYLARIGGQLLNPMNRRGGYERRIAANRARAVLRPTEDD